MVSPTLRAGDIVYVDYVSFHHAAGLAELVAARGAELGYLPPYSPDLSPIENCWSKLKSVLRGLGARSLGRRLGRDTAGRCRRLVQALRLCVKLICKTL
jgi:transposase